MWFGSNLVQEKLSLPTAKGWKRKAAALGLIGAGDPGPARQRRAQGTCPVPGAARRPGSGAVHGAGGQPSLSPDAGASGSTGACGGAERGQPGVMRSWGRTEPREPPLLAGQPSPAAGAAEPGRRHRRARRSRRRSSAAARAGRTRLKDKIPERSCGRRLLTRGSDAEERPWRESGEGPRRYRGVPAAARSGGAGWGGREGMSFHLAACPSLPSLSSLPARGRGPAAEGLA